MSTIIDDAFRYVKRIGDNWAYVPLSKLPQGTEVSFSCYTSFIEDLKEINGAQEKAVTRLSAGTYKLTIFQWPCVLFDSIRGTIITAKSYYSILAPTSKFIANYDKNHTTFRLESGEIQKIFINGTNYFLSNMDRPKMRNQHLKVFSFRRQK